MAVPDTRSLHPEFRAGRCARRLRGLRGGVLLAVLLAARPAAAWAAEEAAAPCSVSECLFLHGVDEGRDQLIMAHRPSYVVLGQVKPGTIRFEGQGEEEYELHFQFSIKVQPIQSLPFIYLGYTQRSFWIVGCCSAPFRETNYNPEAYADLVLNPHSEAFPASSWPVSWGFRGGRVGYEHESNGRDDTKGLSRGWDRGYVELKFAWGDDLPTPPLGGIPQVEWPREPEPLTLYLKYWPAASTSSPEDVDLVDYYGWGEARLQYTSARWQATLMVRHGRLPDTGSGSVELALPLDWAYLRPLLLLRYWSGVGESLIDYDREVNRLMVGVLLAR